VPVPRQPPIAGSPRLLRGRLLRELSSAADHAISVARARSLAGTQELDGVLDQLERDGLVHRRGAWLRLGSASVPTAASTIGP
jgi:hypothetical protein